MIRIVLVSLILCGVSMPVLAEEPSAATREWDLNGLNPKQPQAGDHRPDYYFQNIIQVNLYTPSMFVDDAVANVPIKNFRTPSKPSGYIIKVSGVTKANPEWDNGRGEHFSASMTTKDVEVKTKESISTVVDPVVQDDAEFGSGYCLGKILYAGKIGVIQKLPTYAAPVPWEKAVRDAIKYTPDSALCFGPVSKSPQVLQFETPDIRALKETLLVISGLYPIDCKKKEGSETDHICEFTSKGSVVAGPQSQ